MGKKDKPSGNGKRETNKPLPPTCPNGHPADRSGQCRELGCSYSGGPR
jgi:hypothetical protein